MEGTDKGRMHADDKGGEGKGQEGGEGIGCGIRDSIRSVYIEEGQRGETGS